MKHLCRTLATVLILAFSIFNSSAAVPVAWTNTPAATQPYPLKPVPHGVPINFRVTLKGYTEPPVAPGADLHLWYQTNGMGSAWWRAPATLEGDVITATFGPAQDTGADRVSLFFGAPSNVFASAVLRLTHSPGFAPASLPLPTPVLDFAAVELRNISALTNGWSFGGAPADYETVSNRAMSAVQPAEMEAAIAAIPPPSTDLTPATNYTDGVLASATNNLRSKADLAYRNAIHNGIEKWVVQIQGVDDPQIAEWSEEFQKWDHNEPPVNGFNIAIAEGGYIFESTGGQYPFTLSGGSATVSDGWFTYTLTPVAFAEDRLALVSEVPDAPTNIVEQIAAATNALAERFTAEIEDLIKASEEWNRPGEWDLDYYAIPTSPVFNDYTLETNETTGVVVSNAVITEANSLAARVYSVSLDELSPTAPPAVTLSCSDAGATLEGSLLSATSNGVYTVRGTTADAVTRTAKVPLMQTAAKTVRKSYYVADTNDFREAVNNIMVAGLSDMGAGDWHEYWCTNSEPHGTFRAWQTITPWWAWPGRGCYSPWAVAPKVVVSAAHYGNYRTTGPWTVYDNAGQTNFTVVIGAWVTLVDWARANGYSAEETSVADMGDIKVAPIVQGFFPDNCLPYLADADELAAMFGDMEDVMAWFCPQGDAERYAGNTYPYAIPVKLYRRGVVTEDTPKLPYCTIGWVEPHQFSDYSAATVRADILPLIGTYDEKSWYRLRPGDSGRPVFIRVGFAQDIPISSAHGYGWGPSIPAAAKIIRAYSLQVTGSLPKSLPH